jgi:hypothetical protein
MTDRYAAGNDWRKVEVGVMGLRKERTIEAGLACESGGGIRYVKLVVDASYVAPRYSGYDIL